MFFNNKGAPECHAPELSLELKRAKMEVGVRHVAVHLERTFLVRYFVILLSYLSWELFSFLQKRPARLCFSKQSSFELGNLAYRIATGCGVVAGCDLPVIPDSYPRMLRILLPQLVASDPSKHLPACQYVCVLLC